MSDAMCLLIWCTEEDGFLDVVCLPDPPAESNHKEKTTRESNQETVCKMTDLQSSKMSLSWMSKQHGGGAVTYWWRPEEKDISKGWNAAAVNRLQARHWKTAVELLFSFCLPFFSLSLYIYIYIYVIFTSFFFEYWTLYMLDKCSNTELQFQLNSKCFDFECGCVRKCSYLYKMHTWRTEGRLVTCVSNLPNNITS